MLRTADAGKRRLHIPHLELTWHDTNLLSVSIKLFIRGCSLHEEFTRLARD